MTTLLSPDRCKPVSETALFAEYHEAQGLIAVLSSTPSNHSFDRKNALASLCYILDQYLEVPTLLDPFLADLVTPLGEYCRKNLGSDCQFALSAIYLISKVRGRKRIAKFLPHSVDLVEPILSLLEQLVSAPVTDESMSEEQCPPTWQSIYALWIWLQLLSLTPFDRRLLLRKETIPTLIRLARNHLPESGPIRDTAAACLASWLARQDMEECRNEFCLWSQDVLERSLSMTSNKNHNSIGAAVFLPLGVLQTLSEILDVGTRSTFSAQLPLWHCMLELSERQQNPNVLLRKYICKWLSRMGCAHMPPRIAKWRYQRGGRTSLLENLLGQTKQEHSSKNEVFSEKDDAQDELFEVPDAVEDVMGQLLLALKDKATVVRWSAAKGIGRLNERLPVLCAHDVLDALLAQLHRNKENDTVWHGSCLTLAELARRGLLLEERLHDVIEPVLIPAILFDIRKGRTSVGAHVRDAACYTYWAFARAYSPQVLKPHVARMSQSLVLASLFDREINCRRAASAAFQESVGRQGAQNFPHGIDILTAADYFTLGNRNDCYLNIACFVSRFEEYRKPIIDHLHTVKLFHWDIDIRILASKSLHEIAPMDTEFTRLTVLPHLLEQCTNTELCVRHGAVLGIAEIVSALKDELTDEILLELSDLVAKLEKLRLYRGRGGEIMRAAVCRYIDCISQEQITLTVKQQVRLLDSLDENLKHPKEDIQTAAGLALAALMRSYFPVRENGPSDRLQRRVVDKYVDLVCTSDNPAETRGYALALGSLPKNLLAPSIKVLDLVLTCLIRAARFDTTIENHADAETRRNALRALVSVTHEVDFSESRCPPEVGLSSKQLTQVCECFILGMQDYNTDHRGDVGSWSRIESMIGLKHLIFQAADNGVGIEINLMTRCIGGFLKQLSEKLDNVRWQAGSCLQDILRSSSSPIVGLSFYGDLCESLDIESETNWSDAKTTFPLVVKALKLSPFFHFIVSGIVVSVGALTESVTKEAERALIEWIREKDSIGAGTAEKMEKLGISLLQLFQENKHRGRVVLPLLKTLEKLFHRGLMDVLFNQTGSNFASSLVVCIQTETRVCNDVHRLLSAVSISLGLLSPSNDIHLNTDVLKFVLTMLGHDFPRVRKHTADNLYVRLLEVPSVLPRQENIDNVLDLLLQGQWQSDSLGCDGINEYCAKVAHLVGVEFSLPTPIVDGKKRSVAPPTDDFASYASLVNATF